MLMRKRDVMHTCVANIIELYFFLYITSDTKNMYIRMMKHQDIRMTIVLYLYTFHSIRMIVSIFKRQKTKVENILFNYVETCHELNALPIVFLYHERLIWKELPLMRLHENHVENLS